MIAVMLAAGTGSRLSGADETQPPKSLLRFAGRTLLARHIENLRALGVAQLVLVVGYRAGDIEEELRRLGAGDYVRLVENPDYRRGSLLSLWCAREALAGGGDVLFMDADVLYDRAILDRLLAEGSATCFPYDRRFEPGEEPVKLCLAGGRAVEFRKAIGDVACDEIGEWVGFIRMTPAFAAALAGSCRRLVDEGACDAPYEEAIRDVLLAGAGGAVAFADITGLPWIEIDFPEDVKRAAGHILPRMGEG